VVVAHARDGCLAMATRASRPSSGPNLDFSLVEVVLACWGMPVRRCSWSLKWVASRQWSFTTSTLGCCPIGACGLCRCLPARDREGRADSVLGLAGVERVLVIAPLAICKFKLLLGSVSASSGCLWGRWKGWEKSQCYCRTTATPAGAVTFLKVLSRPFHSSPPEQQGKP
jgi:hypothetical protein